MVMNARFRVLLHGKNFVVKVGPRPARLGFFATRVIDAATADQAIELAKEHVLRDDRFQQNGTILVSEVERVGWLFRRFRPPSGFTFYELQDDG